jgi:hypothetical protein
VDKGPPAERQLCEIRSLSSIRTELLDGHHITAAEFDSESPKLVNPLCLDGGHNPGFADSNVTTDPRYGSASGCFSEGKTESECLPHEDNEADRTISLLQGASQSDGWVINVSIDPRTRSSTPLLAGGKVIGFAYT